MTVELLYNTPLWVCTKVIRTCWDSHDESDTLEHLVYTFDIDGISRACLQELARHRMASLSVNSTRYTLKKLKDEEELYTNAYKYIVRTKHGSVNQASKDALLYLQSLLKEGISNDLVKYCMPESFKTSLVWTINARSLQNFLELRSSKHALWEIQELAKAIYEAVPDEHKYLFKDYVNEL